MTAVVIMAAGKGTRMESDLPKVLHEIAGQTLLQHVLNSARETAPERVVVIVGHRRELVMQSLDNKDIKFATQDPPLGTGHAVMQAEPLLEEFEGDVLVLSGDVPLLRGETLKKLVERHHAQKSAATVATCYTQDPFGYGRIVRNDEDQFTAIVEQKDASEEQRSIREINSGIYCFDARQLFATLHLVRNDNAKGEYYLPDVISLLREAGARVEAARVADFSEVQGINTVAELHEVEAAYLKRQSKSVKS